MTNQAASATASSPLVTLLVVDDHTLFRRGLIALLGQYEGLSVVGEAGDAAQALRLFGSGVGHVRAPGGGAARGRRPLACPSLIRSRGHRFPDVGSRLCARNGPPRLA